MSKRSSSESTTNNLQLEHMNPCESINNETQHKQNYFVEYDDHTAVIENSIRNKNAQTLILYSNGDKISYGTGQTFLLLKIKK